jgi:uncharacterized membrane protein YagU involved in acid resistance
MNTLAATSTIRSRSSAWKTILLAWVTAGCLDLLAAIVVYSVIMQRVTTIRLLQGIARGALGNSAYEGGVGTALAGVGFHFTIAFCFTVFYFLIFPHIPFLKKQRIVSGLLYGIFAWCVMNLAVLPLLKIAPLPTKWDSIVRGVVILMFCIGLPISLIVSRYYLSKAKR